MNEQEKEKYMQFKIIEEQIKILSEQLDLFEKQQKELANTKEALEKLPGLSENDEILIPLAAGMFIKGKVTDNSKLLVNVGQNVTVSKTVEQALKLVEEQSQEIASYEKKATDQLMKLSQLADKVNQELFALQKGHNNV